MRCNTSLKKDVLTIKVVLNKTERNLEKHDPVCYNMRWARTKAVECGHEVLNTLKKAEVRNHGTDPVYEDTFMFRVKVEEEPAPEVVETPEPLPEVKRTSSRKPRSKRTVKKSEV